MGGEGKPIPGGDLGGLTVWTIGHSTRELDEFLGLLRENEIGVLVDVRHYPGSKRLPRFNKDELARELGAAGLGYEHIVELGGRRKARTDSRNTAWRNEAFRGYADYMETAEFEAGLSRLVGIARDRRAAMMCAEGVWWRCHRSLVSDVLKVRGASVLHIMGKGKAEEHPMTSAARVVDGRLSYEGEREGLFSQE